MTRIAALSDIHGNVAALEAVIADITREKPDRVVIAGDLVLHGPEPVATVDMLRNLVADGAAIISGNTDIAVADFDYAAAFPWMTDGVPDAIVAASEWANEALGEERV
jgi:predicted phosphodiesterase